MTYGPFWNRTLKLFRSQPVRLTLTGGRELVGDIDMIGDTSVAIRKADGATELISLDQLRQCLPVDANL